MKKSQGCEALMLGAQKAADTKVQQEHAYRYNMKMLTQQLCSGRRARGGQQPRLQRVACSLKQTS